MPHKSCIQSMGSLATATLYTKTLIALVLHLLINARQVSAQREGFLNIDCGGTGPYVDEYGASWVPDDQYIVTGNTTSISGSEEYRSRPRHFQRVRYFPDSSRKHCYALPVGFNQTYLIRPWFLYGNYDNFDTIGEVNFDVIVGADTFEYVKVRDTLYEFVVKSDNKTLDFCLARSSASSPNTTAPFISAIEMRLLDTGMYSLPNSRQGLSMPWGGRIDFGVNSTDKDKIRYPEDNYDRIWLNDMYLGFLKTRNYSPLSQPVSPEIIMDQPPSAVMSTGLTSSGHVTIILEFPNITTTNRSCYFNFYFAELEDLRENTTREFMFHVYNGGQTAALPVFSSELINIQANATGPRRSLEYSAFHAELSSPTFHFVPTEASTLGPLINAGELFFAHTNLNLGTEHNDKIAMANILSHFKVSGWSGDPCLPKQYSWNLITCDSPDRDQFARITELNLSNHQLRGTIPKEIQNLVHLTKIFLHNNMLEGELPDFSSLKNLTTLHLQNNKLTGTVPASLMSIQDLSIQNNNFDCITGPELAQTFNGTIPRCKPSNKAKILGGVTAGVVVIFLMLVGLVFWLYRKRSAQPQLALVDSPQAPKRGHSPTFPSFSSKTFGYQEIEKATDSFKTKLGEGSFGPVYHGRLSNGCEIAVKVLSASSSQGEKEFNREIEVLSVVHHKNVVTFYGSCKEDSKLILVYEYLSNGTLREHLYGGKRPTLSWKRRLEILLDAAQGLDYLHGSCNLHMIHRDVKTTNILLDSDMRAKVTDFGLTKLYDKNEGTHVSTLVKGTRGYFDPDYHESGRLTEKSDVYSFGVMIFEVICGREPISLLLPEDEVVLTTWALQELQKGDLAKVIDPKLTTYNEQTAWKVLELAMQCIERDPGARPSMNTITIEMQEALMLEYNGDSGDSNSGDCVDSSTSITT